jgi:predicted NBD/HSP70 family sugar kinase
MSISVPRALSLVEREVVAALRRHGTLDRAELTRRCGLPRTTLNDTLARLRDRGLIEEEARPTAGRRGRPPAAVRLHPRSGVVGVISMTHGTLRAAVVGFDNTIYGEAHVDAFLADLPRGPVEPGLQMLDGVLAAAGMSRSDLVCAVLGVPMPIKSGAGAVPLPPPRSANAFEAPPGWADTDPAKPLSDELGVPAWCENDANLAALGEMNEGAGMGLSHFIHIKVAQGVGSGIVVNRQLCRGSSGLAGEMLHLHVRETGPICMCGGRGCLITEADSSITDIVQPAHPEKLTIDAVFAMAGSGDVGANRALRDFGALLGRPLADLCVFVNLEAIIIDGLLGEAAHAVIDGMRTAIDRYAYPRIAADVRIVPGALGERAEIIGGAAFAGERLSAGPGAIT